MFNWLRRKKSDSGDLELQNTSPPKIRQPTHAARDARMSIPVGEREYYEILEARKRAGGGPSSIGTSVMKGKGKGKASSPLAYNDGGECFRVLRHKSSSNTCNHRSPVYHGLSHHGLARILRHHLVHEFLWLRSRRGSVLGITRRRVQETQYSADRVHE